jgi:hypothetical protein
MRAQRKRAGRYLVFSSWLLVAESDLKYHYFENIMLCSHEANTNYQKPSSRLLLFSALPWWGFVFDSCSFVANPT